MPCQLLQNRRQNRLTFKAPEQPGGYDLRQYDGRKGLEEVASVSFKVTTREDSPQPPKERRVNSVEYFDYNSFAASTASLTTFTFDDLSRGNGVLSGNEYATRGLKIAERNRQRMNVFSAPENGYFYPTNFNSQPNGVSSSSGVNFDCPSCSDSFDFIFSTTVTAAGLWVGNLNGSTEVQFLASDGRVIASEVLDEKHKGVISSGAAVWDNRIFYGVTSSLGIARIRTTNPPHDGDGVVYDDIQFGSALEAQSAGTLPGTDQAAEVNRHIERHDYQKGKTLRALWLDTSPLEQKRINATQNLVSLQ